MASKSVTDGYTTSSPASPPTSPRQVRHCRRRPQLKHCRRRESVLFVFHHHSRRNYLLRTLLLLLPLVYFSGLISCVWPLSALLRPSPPGSLYLSHEVFNKLRNDIRSDNSSAIELSSIWRYQRKLKEQRPCFNRTASGHLEASGTDQYLIIEANGGLNQQRSSICNAVAVAGLLNATLVIPRLEFHNVWRDPSKFSDIYDEDHFIETIGSFVHVVRELPTELLERHDFNVSDIPSLRVQAWAPTSYYLAEVHPILQQQRVVRISPFANRLAMNVPPKIQFLRCLANFEALRFSSTISTIARELISRMTERSSLSGGKYVSVHLRFEEDMVAFSCCQYDGGKAEQYEMDAIREKGWGKKFKHKASAISPGLNRMNGKCPMTPLEVGMMLRGLGFSNNTSIYLASGKIYKAERNLAPLREMFPLLETKESLATTDELAIFQGFSSRLAALDYMVSLYSEVFVTTQGGNFPHFLMGHRRFLHNGHAKTINPDKVKLASLLHNTSISWDAFKSEIISMLAESDRKGIMVPRVKKSNRKSSLYTNPLPECRCLWESQISNPHKDKYLMNIND